MGGVLAVLGFMMLSISYHYYAIFLTQGIAMGLGFGLIYVPTVTLISRSFDRHRALALGVATSGAPTGGIIYTVAFDRLLPQLGFQWTVRILAFIMLSLFILAAILLLPQKESMKCLESHRRIFDMRAVKDLPFWSFTTANFLLYLGYITPYYYIPTYAEINLGTSRSMASYVLIISQGASIIGRVTTTVFAHYFGSMISWVLCGMLSGILCLVWISADTLPRFIITVAFYGKSPLSVHASAVYYIRY